MALTSGSKLGPYEILSAIGAGGMGEVYRARDSKLNREVALKVLPALMANDAERMARFQREAQVLASLNHPNIASIYGLEDSGGVRALVMELVEGPTLAERISVGARGARPPGETGAVEKGSGNVGERRSPLQIDEALGIAKQITEALEAAHERGIIHRDLKPANIKITSDGAVKVLDFGLAKALTSEDSSSGISNSPTISIAATQAGMILGTAAYMSPEQAKGKKVDRRADIWAFGCVLYEMLTGRKTFEGETTSDVLAAVIRAEPEWNALRQDTPASIRKLLQRCLQKDPKQRLRDIGEACITIEETLGRVDVGAGLAPPENAQQAAPLLPRWRSVLPWTVAALALVAAAVFAWLALRPARFRPSDVTRLSVTFPSDLRFTFPDTPILAISRDGRNLVFIAEKGGVPQIYLRTLAEPEVKPIAGTEGAYAPFLSPDGQWVGFFAGSKLKKVSVAGGPPVVLCDAFTPRGASWMSDDTIIFAPDYASGLFRVSSAGGKPEAVTMPDAAKNERTHRWPDVLPNGQGVIFLIGSRKNPGDYDLADLAVFSFRTHQTQILLNGANAPHYVASGHIVFGRNGVLYAVPFDQDTRELKGQPVPVLSGVGGDVSSGAGYWSVSDNGTLAYVARSVRPPDETLVVMNRKGETKILPLPRRPYTLPRFSPDAKRLAFGIGAGWGATGDIWTYDLAGNALSRLTFGNDAECPIWSPDGKLIAYQSATGGVGIKIKAADGSGQERAIADPSNYAQIPESWSPDGKTLAFVTSESTENTMTVSVDSHDQPRLFQKRAYGAVFSPDGRWMAYGSTESGETQVYVLAYPGPSGKWQISQERADYPKWTKHGKELVFLQNEKVMAVDVDTQGSFRAGPPHLLFALPPRCCVLQTSPAVNYDVTPDGEQFIFVGEVSAAAAPSQFEVTLNWLTELRGLTSEGRH